MLGKLRKLAVQKIFKRLAENQHHERERRAEQRERPHSHTAQHAQRGREPDGRRRRDAVDLSASRVAQNHASTEETDACDHALHHAAGHIRLQVTATLRDTDSRKDEQR